MKPLHEERRAAARLRVREIDRQVAARLKYGAPLTLIDVSPNGALIEVPERLNPGAHLVIEFLSANTDQTMRVPSKVTRSSLVAINGGLKYRIACAFKRPFALQEYLAAQPPLDLMSQVNNIDITLPEFN
jgi:hypothetical protein